jgi:hypothetical protein
MSRVWVWEYRHVDSDRLLARFSTPAGENFHWAPEPVEIPAGLIQLYLSRDGGRAFEQLGEPFRFYRTAD